MVFECRRELTLCFSKVRVQGVSPFLFTFRLVAFNYASYPVLLMHYGPAWTWARQSRAGGALKISLHQEAFGNCHTYTTADGTAYVPLVISMAALRRVLDGQQSVTTVSQFSEN